MVADALEVVYAGLDVTQGGLLVAGIALLLDGDVAAVADLFEGGLDAGIIQRAGADGAHGSFAAAVEETDVLAHDLLVNLLVDILEVNVVEDISVLLEVGHGIHIAIVEVAGVQAEAGDLIRHVLYVAGDLIGELDVGAGVRVDHGTDAPAVGALADCADMTEELFPLLRMA